jgi:DAK2 domain fusion protein YloV
MAVYSFNGNDMKLMLRGAVDLLEQSREHIDSLNVFPVPDGDTGSNMFQTLTAALAEAESINSDHIGLVAEAAARGALVGARGNSGVILSQVLQGFARTLSAKENASATDLAAALDNGSQTAYRAVMVPVEGTILTVVKESAAGAARSNSLDLLRILAAVFRSACTALGNTPELLPVLKQAGVVDAGGKGFVTILEGAKRALKSASPGAKLNAQVLPEAKYNITVAGVPADSGSKQSIMFAYCTELIMRGEYLPQGIIKNSLYPLGDCLMVVGDDKLLKVHIHSNHPGLVLECCLSYGTINDIKINNMIEQNKKTLLGNEPTGFNKPFGILSVGAGEGIAAIMKNLGADIVIDGGQTLNPSTGEILKSASEIPASKIIILPNNKNIVLSAEQASDMSPKDIAVIPSKSIPQGIAALIALNTEADFEMTTKKMKEALNKVRTGEVTHAIRDSIYGNLNIKKGEYICIIDGDLQVAGSDLAVVLEEALKIMDTGDDGLVTLYRGENLDQALLAKLAEEMQEKFSRLEFEIHEGGQPVYDLIISVE